MIDILMATFNGGHWLRQQIDSILAQTSPEWRLIIRDDGSADETVRICQEYALRYPEKIRLLVDDCGRLKSGGNFSRLLAQTSRQADYTMFSDQDDVWEPRKIEILLAATQEMEAQHGPAVPILTHSDSQVVDENLHLIAPSLLKYLNRAPNPDVNRLCMELPILGHSVMMNRACKVLGGASVPDGFGSWDWWFPLVAVVFGYIHFVKEPLVRYRRHPSTAILLRGHGLSAYLTRSLRDHHRRVNISLRQCEIFHKIFEDRLDPEHKAFFASVSRIRSASWLMRRVLVVRHRLFKTGFLKTAGVVLAV